MVLMDSFFFDIGFRVSRIMIVTIMITKTRTIYNEKDNGHISLYIKMNI